MITFRKILAASSGKLVSAYFTEHQPDAERDLRCEPGVHADQEGRLTAYYTGREMRAHWRVDMPQAVAQALGIDPTRSPKAGELNHLFEAKRGDTGLPWSRWRRENSSLDFTFSPHKSVTLAIEFAESPAEEALLWTAVLRANDAAMRAIAGDLGWARSGFEGKGVAEPGEVGWVSFPHTQARPTLQVRDGETGITYLAEFPTVGDPQTHVHNPFFNLVVTDDGRLGSLDTQHLTNTRVHVWGALGQAVLAEEMRRLGVRVAVDPTGRFAVLPAIDQRVVDHFSKGHRQAERNAKKYARRLGEDWEKLSAERKFGLMQSAAVNERHSKAARGGAKREGLTPKEDWRFQAKALGWMHRTVLEGTAYDQLTDAQRYDAAYAFAARHLARAFETAAVLDQDVVELWAIRGLIGAGYKGSADVERVVGLIRERGFEFHGQQAYLVEGVSDGRMRVTNSEQVRIERRVAELARVAAQDRTGALTHAALRQAIENCGIKFNNDHGAAQVAAIYALGTAGGIAFLTGIAGAGKSTLLTPLVMAYHADTRFSPRGREVIGTANAWLQADALKDCGVDRTIALDPLLRSIDSGKWRPTQNTVLIIEEMSQVGPRSMQRLMELQAETGMTIRGLGDREQCQAIEAGDSIALLQRAIPIEARPELLSTVRQKTDELKRVASMFRNKDGMTAEARTDEVFEALEMKRKVGTARLLGGDQDEVNRATADFFLRRRDALEAAGATKSVSCSALTNAAAAEISAEIRKTLRQRGEIVGEERWYQAIDQRGEIYDLPVAKGDRLRLFQRTGARFGNRFGWLGNNGSMVTVEAITETGLRLRNRHGDVGDVTWDRLVHARSGRLLVASGWAQTVDSIQGITSAEHINALTHGTSGLTAFRNYPAESRAEWETWTLISEAGLFEAVRHARAIGDQSPITTEQLWQQAAKDMAYAPRKPLGLDLVEGVRKDVDAATDQWMQEEHRVHRQKASGRNHTREHRQRMADRELRTALAGKMDGYVAQMRGAAKDRTPPRLVAANSLGRLQNTRAAPQSAPAPERGFEPGPG